MAAEHNTVLGVCRHCGGSGVISKPGFYYRIRRCRRCKEAPSKPAAAGSEPGSQPARHHTTSAPREPHPLDVALVMEVERARYRQKEFSDSHWANLLLATYRAICPGGNSPLVAAIEDIMRTFCHSAKTAKAKAAKYRSEGAPLPSWIKLPPSEGWGATCRKIRTRGIQFGPNGEFLCLLGDGD